jgi:hypothetical protein
LAAKFVEPVEEQADPAKFVDPLFEERDQNLAVENEEEQGVSERIQRRRPHSLARQALLKQILIQILIIWREISDRNWRQNNISSL